MQLVSSMLFLLIFAPISSCAQEQRWDAVEELIERRFPNVRQLSTDSLASWLSDSSLQQPVLLDVRELTEYDVSHLPNARHLAPSTTEFSNLDGLDRDHPLVLYCSVGYRSSEMAERLKKNGFTNVYNLDGSIFRWANEGRAVVKDGEVVERVHPYDAVWGVLLQSDLHWGNNNE